MAKKQQKERQDQARKQSRERALSGEVDDDEDEDVVLDAEGEPVASSSLPQSSTFDEYKDVKPVVDTDPIKTAMVTILRVQESTLQEARLISTGNFKDLQVCEF